MCPGLGKIQGHWYDFMSSIYVFVGCRGFKKVTASTMGFAKYKDTFMDTLDYLYLGIRYV